MSWGTEFNVDIYLSRTSFNCKQDLVDAIEIVEKNIKLVEDKLHMYAISNVKDIVPKEWEDEPVRWVHDKIEELLNDYREYNERLVNLRHYLTVYKEGNNAD